MHKRTGLEFSNMKLLLIMPRFFDYPKCISDELISLGYDVDFYDDRPSTNPFIKAAIKLNKHLVHFQVSRYFKRLLTETKCKSYDYVLIISGQSLSFSVSMIRKLRESQKKALFVLYQWNSISNFPSILKYIGLFDKAYSFDRKDARNYDNLNFLPLFYSIKYEKMGTAYDNKKKYDFCFIGTAHPKKYRFIKTMVNELKTVYPKQFLYFFFPSRFVYLYRKLFNKEFKFAKFKEFHFTPLNETQLIDVYTSTKCVLDCPQKGQTGLTIRVIEALGSKKKIITTNKDILNYDFYRRENIYVFSDKFDFDDVFFNSEYKDIPIEIYKKYSLKNWLLEILKV